MPCLFSRLQSWHGLFCSWLHLPAVPEDRRQVHPRGQRWRRCQVLRVFVRCWQVPEDWSSGRHLLQRLSLHSRLGVQHDWCHQGGLIWKPNRQVQQEASQWCNLWIQQEQPVRVSTYFPHISKASCIPKINRINVYTEANCRVKWRYLYKYIYAVFKNNKPSEFVYSVEPTGRSCRNLPGPTPDHPKYMCGELTVVQERMVWG